MAKKVWWEDPLRSKQGKCPVCKECTLTLDGRYCMHGGPFIGYVEIDENERRVARARNERGT